MNIAGIFHTLTSRRKVRLNPAKKSSINLVFKKPPSRTTKTTNSHNTGDVLNSTTVLQPKGSSKMCYSFLPSAQSPEKPQATKNVICATHSRQQFKTFGFHSKINKVTKKPKQNNPGITLFSNHCEDPGPDQVQSRKVSRLICRFHFQFL